MEFWLSQLIPMGFRGMGSNFGEFKSGGMQSEEQRSEITSAPVRRQRESYVQRLRNILLTFVARRGNAVRFGSILQQERDKQNQLQYTRNDSYALKSAILWEVTPCSPPEFHRRFRRTYRSFRFEALSQTHRALTRRPTYIGLHGVTSQKMVLETTNFLFT
jgi:hypothetical protein